MTQKQWIFVLRFMIFMMKHTLKNWGPAPMDMFEKDDRVIFLRSLESELAGNGG